VAEAYLAVIFPLVQTDTSIKPTPPKRPESWSSPTSHVNITELGGTGGGRFFSEDGGAVTKEYANDSSLLSQINLQLSGEDSVLQPYLENVFVRAAVKAIQNGMTQLDFGMWSGDPGEEGSARVEVNAISDLLKRPNRDMTEAEFWTVHANSMKLDGEVYWFLANRRGKPVSSSKASGQITSKIAQIIPVPGSCIEVHHDDSGWPEYYTYSVTGASSKRSAKFPWGSVIAFRDYDPYNSTRGTGDVQSCVRPIDLQHQVLRYMDATLRNGGGPGGFIIFKEAVSPAELERRQMEADDSNSTEERRRLKLLDRDAKYVPNNMSPSDMEYTTLWDRMIDAILTCIGVPGPVVGRYENATYNNVDTAYREMWRGPNGILALAAFTADIVTNKMLPRMARMYPESAKLVAYFDPANIDVLQESQHEGIKLAKDVAVSGIGISLNSALKVVGANVDPVDGGDAKFIKNGQTDRATGEEFGAAPPPTLTSGDEEKDEKLAYINKIKAAIALKQA